jgi:hypothetical protein
MNSPISSLCLQFQPFYLIKLVSIIKYKYLNLSIVPSFRLIRVLRIAFQHLNNRIAVKQILHHPFLISFIIFWVGFFQLGKIPKILFAVGFFFISMVISSFSLISVDSTKSFGRIIAREFSHLLGLVVNSMIINYHRPFRW